MVTDMSINKINLTASNYLPQLINDLNSFQAGRIESKDTEKHLTQAIKQGEETAAFNLNDLLAKHNIPIRRISTLA